MIPDYPDAPLIAAMERDEATAEWEADMAADAAGEEADQFDEPFCDWLIQQPEWKELRERYIEVRAKEIEIVIPEEDHDRGY